LKQNKTIESETRNHATGQTSDNHA